MSPTRYQTLFEPIAERCARNPDWPGLVLIGDDDRRDVVTAAALHADMVRDARGFCAAGVRAGDVVVVATGHGRDLVTAFLGAMYRGAVPTIFSGYPSQSQVPERFGKRVAELVMSSRARAVVTTAALRDEVAARVAESGCLVVSSDDLQVAAKAGPSFSPASSSKQTAFLQYTSGSGGTPKGIAHTHGRVLRHIEAMLEVKFIQPHDVLVGWLPLYHDLGLVGGLLAPLTVGIRSVLMSPQRWVRNPALLLRALDEFGGTRCFMPNFGLNHCARGIRARALEGVNLGHCEALFCGAEPVRVESMRQFAERFTPLGFDPSTFGAGYGMAEMVLAICVTAPGRAPSVDWIDRCTLQEQRRVVAVDEGTSGSVSFVSCGPPLPDTEVRVVGPDDDALPERHVGEITLRGATMFDGYYLRPDLTAEAMRDGWFYTGDLGYLSGGELYITGRKNDLIIVGGRNVQPEDVERLAEDVPGLRPGRSVAFGVDDPLTGSERIVLICETAATHGEKEKLEIERALRQRSIQQLDVPLGDVRFVAKGWVLKTSSGKLARPANREKYLKETGSP